MSPVERAIEMFTDLRKWEEARQFAHTANAEQTQELVRRQAVWAEETKDMSAAAETYLSAGDYMKVKPPPRRLRARARSYL